MLARGGTGHKVQGKTLDKTVIGFDWLKHKNFHNSQRYVVLGRVISLVSSI